MRDSGDDAPRIVVKNEGALNNDVGTGIGCFLLVLAPTVVVALVLWFAFPGNCVEICGKTRVWVSTPVSCTCR